MKVTKKELEKIKRRIDLILADMEDNNTDTIEAEPNTYGLYGAFISIPGAGFVELPEGEEWEWDD